MGIAAGGAAGGGPLRRGPRPGEAAPSRAISELLWGGVPAAERPAASLALEAARLAEERQLQEAQEAALLEEAIRNRAPCEEELRFEELKRQQEVCRLRCAQRAQRLEDLKDALAEVQVTPEASKPQQNLAAWRLVLLLGKGVWFYHNQSTGEQSWEAPAGAPTVSRSPGETSQHFQLVLQLGTGVWYYYDEAAAATSWETPAGVQEMQQCPAEPPAPWRRVLHVSAGEWCYQNEVTGETSWEPPPKEAAPAQERRGVPPPPPPRPVPKPPAGAPPPRRASAVQVEVPPPRSSPLPVEAEVVWEARVGRTARGAVR